MNAVTRDNLVFYSALTAVILFFCWSRFDSNDRIYYFGDGNSIISMIKLRLEGNDWEAAIAKGIEERAQKKDNIPFFQDADPNRQYYTFTGYIAVSTAICNLVYTAGFENISIQQILHGLNVVFQILTLYLLYVAGCRLNDRHTGLLAMAFFTALPLAVMESHYERPESWLCLLGTALVYSALRFRDHPRITCLAMGGLIGFAFASKYSQVFLGIIPAILLAGMIVSDKTKSRINLARLVVVYGSLVCVGILIALAINIPFIFTRWPDLLAEIRDVGQIYQNVNYPYAMEHYSYIGQLGVFAHYFLTTLGWPWIIAFLIGASCLIMPRLRPVSLDTATALAISSPAVFLIFYFPTQLIFIERNFVSIQGFVCLATAVGLSCIAQRRRLLACALAIPVLIVPLQLDMVFVKNYIHKTENSPRQQFEQPLKTDFEGFWIKNVYFTHNYTGALPEKAPKAPRLYKVEDLNEHWSRDYVKKLQASGFTRVALYCSEFAHLPPNNLTIYHSAAKYHYFVRNDEWPTAVAKDYFRSNCQ